MVVINDDQILNMTRRMRKKCMGSRQRYKLGHFVLPIDMHLSV
jgi:hypothetical protein